MPHHVLAMWSYVLPQLLKKMDEDRYREWVEDARDAVRRCDPKLAIEEFEEGFRDYKEMRPDAVARSDMQMLRILFEKPNSDFKQTAVKKRIIEMLWDLTALPVIKNINGDFYHAPENLCWIYTHVPETNEYRQKSRQRIWEIIDGYEQEDALKATRMIFDITDEFTPLHRDAEQRLEAQGYGVEECARGFLQQTASLGSATP